MNTAPSRKRRLSRSEEEECNLSSKKQIDSVVPPVWIPEHAIVWEYVYKNGQRRVDPSSGNDCGFFEDESSAFSFQKLRNYITGYEVEVGIPSFSIQWPCGRIQDVSSPAAWSKALSDILDSLHRLPLENISPMRFGYTKHVAQHRDEGQGNNQDKPAAPLNALTACADAMDIDTPFLTLPNNQVQKSFMDPDLMKHWPATCEFFCHSEFNTSEGVLLRGFAQPIPPASMVRMYCQLRSKVTGEKPEFQLTMQEQVAQMGVLALAWAHPIDWHLGEGKRCKSIFGIRHTCQAGSCKVALYRYVARGPSIIFAHGDAAFASAIALVRSMFSDRDPPRNPYHAPSSLMRAVLFQRGKLSPQPLLKNRSGVIPNHIFGSIVRQKSLIPLNHPKSTTLAPLQDYIRLRSCKTSHDTSETTILVVDTEGLDRRTFLEAFSRDIDLDTKVGKAKYKVSGMLHAMSVMSMPGLPSSSWDPVASQLSLDVKCPCPGTCRTIGLSDDLDRLFHRAT
ncbi:hypothetical protein AK830_g10202 [Neonectria ditissima]|uniref:Uncharacterized protein n=1 Tax=Neonectria ditissima TaxID=78410 RepID=A0A0P7AQG4_9HYPO|nr:hypothetical protein AK830_g10202 [Neonectria ditissima]